MELNEKTSYKSDLEKKKGIIFGVGPFYAQFNPFNLGNHKS